MATGFHGFHGASFDYFRVRRLNLPRLYAIYLVKQLTYPMSKDLEKCSMLVKVKTTIVSIGRYLIELYVYVLKLLINVGLPCLWVASINPYSFELKVERECL